MQKIGHKGRKWHRALTQKIRKKWTFQVFSGYSLNGMNERVLSMLSTVYLFYSTTSKNIMYNLKFIIFSLSVCCNLPFSVLKCQKGRPYRNWHSAINSEKYKYDFLFKIKIWKNKVRQLYKHKHKQNKGKIRRTMWEKEENLESYIETI